MKKFIFYVAISISLVACSSGTQITSSWRDPGVTVNAGQIHKFVVAALIKDQSVRRNVEDNMASYMPGKAVQSYVVFGTDSLKDDADVYNQKLKSEGYDGIVIMRLSDVDKDKRYVPGNYPVYYNTWRGYWSYSWPSFYSPGYYTTDKTYYIEVNVYSLLQNKLIWSGTTSTINPGNNDQLYNNVSKVIYNKMKSEGFLQS